MDVYQQLVALSELLDEWESKLETEEATKQALVLPFLNALGYNVFDPRQVTPEFVADVADRRGEKVDYALLFDGKPVILIECKSAGTSLNTSHLNQLIRYFSATGDARIAILTNGSEYRFYTDLQKPNVMDETPFLTLDLHALDERMVRELERITRDSFDIEGMLSTALELAYLSGMRAALERQLTEPDEEVVRWLTQQVYDGRLVASVRQQFEERTRRAFRSLINDKVNEVLRRAVDIQDEPPLETSEEEELLSDESPTEHEPGIVTTAEEIEGYEIVKAVLETTVTPERVGMRDGQQYCAILLDNNNRRTICRFYFGPRRKSIALFDADKRQTKHALGSLDDIYHYADELRETVRRFDEAGA